MFKLLFAFFSRWSWWTVPDQMGKWQFLNITIIYTESPLHLTNTLKNLIQSSSASQSPAQNLYIILRNRLSQIPRYCNGHFRISSFSVCLKPVPLSKFCTHTFITSSMSYINGFCPKLASTTSPGVWSPTVGYKFGCAKNKQGEENYV